MDPGFAMRGRCPMAGDLSPACTGLCPGRENKGGGGLSLKV
jgi:hypothetical protein